MALGWRDQYIRYREFFLNIEALYKQRADIRSFLEIILSISTTIIFLVFALKPTALTIISLYNEIQEKQKTVDALNQKINNLQLAQNLISQNQNAIVTINSSVGNSAQPDLIMQQIQALAVKDSVTVLGISVGQVNLVGITKNKTLSQGSTPLPDNAQEMPILLSVSGDYPALSSFLKDFESLRMITQLDSAGVSASSTEKGLIIVSSVTGRVPYLGQ
jgi:Tfp pilus assembly protein PilO